MIGYIWNLIVTKPIWNSNTILSLITMYLPLNKFFGKCALVFVPVLLLANVYSCANQNC